MTVKANSAITISFAAIDSSGRPSRKSGLSWNVGDVQVTQDGAGFSNTTHLPVEIGSTGRYALSLTSAEFNGMWIHVKISKTGIDDIDLTFSTSGHHGGAVVADASNTDTRFKTDLTSIKPDFCKDQFLLFTDAVNVIQEVKKVSSYDIAGSFITVTASFTDIPTAGDRFILINV